MLNSFLGIYTFLVATVKLWSKIEEMYNVYFVKAVFTSLLEEFNQNFLNANISIWLGRNWSFRIPEKLMGVCYLQSANMQTKQVTGLYLFPSAVIKNLDYLM